MQSQILVIPNSPTLDKGCLELTNQARENNLHLIICSNTFTFSSIFPITGYPLEHSFMLVYGHYLVISTPSRGESLIYSRDLPFNSLCTNLNMLQSISTLRLSFSTSMGSSLLSHICQIQDNKTFSFMFLLNLASTGDLKANKQ